MNPLLINTEVAEGQAEVIASIATQINTLSDQLRSISNSITYEIASVGSVQNQMSPLFDAMTEQENGLVKMSAALLQSIQTYMKSEGLIVDTYGMVEAAFASNDQGDSAAGNMLELEKLIGEILDINGDAKVGLLKTWLLSIKESKIDRKSVV